MAPLLSSLPSPPFLGLEKAASSALSPDLLLAAPNGFYELQREERDPRGKQEGNGFHSLSLSRPGPRECAAKLSEFGL